jgi:hypothetical protein
MACLQPQCRKGGVTLESPKFCPRPRRHSHHAGKLGPKDVLRNLRRAPRRIGKPKEATLSLKFTTPRDLIEQADNPVYVASGITASHKKTVSAEARLDSSDLPSGCIHTQRVELKCLDTSRFAGIEESMQEYTQGREILVIVRSGTNINS